MVHPKILVAEAELGRAQFLERSLESAGFEVYQATDSASAWRVIEEQNLVMALIDSNLPGLLDCNILVCVRADPGLAKLPVLILGESLFSEEATKWLNLGADDYISRSISSGLLRAEVRAKLRRAVIDPD